jgi:hypothetical protein
MDIVLLRSGENVVMKGLGNCRFARANEEWGFVGGNAWSTAFAATWEKGANWPTIAIGNYVDRFEEISPWGSCTDNWLHRPDGAEKRFARPLALKPSFCRSPSCSPIGRAAARRISASPMTASIMKAGRSRCGAWSRASRRNSMPRRMAGSTSASGAWASPATTSILISTRNISSPAWPTTACRRWRQCRGQGSPKPAYKDIAYPLGLTAHRPFMGEDLRPSTAWHSQFEDVNNDGRVDLFIAKGNVAEMPDFAQKDPNNLLVQGPRWQIYRDGGQGRCGLHQHGARRPAGRFQS